MSAQRLDKLSRRRRKDLATLVDDADRSRKNGRNKRNRDELAALDFVLNRRKGEDAYAEADLDRLFDRFNVVKFRHNVDAHAVLTQRLVGFATDRQIAFERYEIQSL